MVQSAQDQVLDFVLLSKVMQKVNVYHKRVHLCHCFSKLIGSLEALPTSNLCGPAVGQARRVSRIENQSVCKQSAS